MRTFAFVLAFLLVSAASTSGTAAETPLPYRVGVARADITPSHPIRLNGFGFRRTESEGTYQKIWAKALAVEGPGGAPVVLVTVDVLGIPADIHDELARRLEKKAGLKKERLAVTATHTHTGPMLSGANPTIFGTPIPKEHQANIDRYTPVFVDRLEEAALAALKDLRPAKLEWGVGTVGFGMNRRTKGGPVDHDLPVLVARDEKGAVRAIYLSYACHCVTLSHNKVGGDWAGFAGATIEEMFPGSVALVAVGCGADQNPDSGVSRDREDIAAGQGRAIANEVRRLTKNYLAPVAGPVAARVESLDLPLADLPTRQQWEEKAKRMDAIGHHARVTLAKLDRGEKLPTSVTYPVQTWAFGDSLAMVHLPGEVVVDYSLRLKRELDSRRIWVTAYANNAPCYIPSERVLKLGGYEGGGAMIYYDLPNPFKPGLEGVIVGAVRKQVEKAFHAKFDPKKTGDTLPLSPQQSLARLRTKPGLSVELVAAEPLVADPVALAFGLDGRLWVAEMADYPTGRTGKFDPGGRVVVLEGDNGSFHKSTVFLDNLPFPTGVLPWRKGVLVCAAPDILYAEDTNGDGKADVVERLYSGFGTENYQARVNSLQYGLDGWVYGSCGLFGGNILCHRTGKTIPLGDRDFRIKPDTGELEPATGRTQQGRVRDDRGNWFGCDNSNLIRHYALDDHYLRRNPSVAFPNASVSVPAGNPRQLFSIKSDAQRFQLSGPPNTVTAACGLGIYRDDQLGREFDGDSFTCEPVNLLVHRRRLKPLGSTFTGVRAEGETGSEFLASTDSWFRPVHAITGPDGGLWVADMYRFLIEHPRWVPEADLARIDVRAGAGLGRVYRVRRAGAPLRPWPRFDKLDTAGLVAALESPNGWQRDAAMMTLLWKNDPAAAELLEKLLTSSSRGATRLQALCTLDTLGRLKPARVESALADADAGVRRQAVRVAEPHLAKSPELAGRVAKLATDSDPQVRLQVAYSLGSWPDRQAGAVLARLALTPKADPFVAAAAVSSLNATNLPAFAAAVFGTAGADGPPAQLVGDLLASAAGIDNGASLPELLAVAAGPVNGAYRPWQLAAAAGALDSLGRQGKAWESLPSSVRPTLTAAVEFARKVVEKDDAPASETLAAIPLLGRDPATRSADVDRLVELTAATRAGAVQAAAVTALSRVPDAKVPAALVRAWAGASPALRTRILDVLLARKEWVLELLAAVEKGTISAGQIDAARRQRLTTATDPTVRTRAAKLFAGGTNPDRQKVIEEYRAGLPATGDKAKGKVVFARVCSACHLVDGVGHTVGPDLTALANKSAPYLLSEVFDPSRNLDSRYAEYRATTKDGRVISGLLAAETATSITLRGQQAKDETILRTDLESLRGTTKSLMPEGLEKDISKQDAADLIAYLTSAEPPAKKLPGNDPAEVLAANGSVTLSAARAFVYGEAITFESEFKNIGYWHGQNDRAVWKVQLDKPAEFDIFLDYACATESAGNPFVVDGIDPPLRGKVAGTGGWDRYTLAKVGTVKLPAGGHRLTIRPDGPVKGALLDLRTVYLVPVGSQPKVDPGARQPTSKPRTPVEAAKLILDDKAPRNRREEVAKESASQAAAVIRAMTADLPRDNPKEEYRCIPWVWRVAIAAGRANDAVVLRELVDASLPKSGDAFRDWQAVVLGGGVINGLSLEGVWPGKRLPELLKGRPDLIERWRASLKQAHDMAESEKVPAGTRYDALRMIALDQWAAARPQLVKYLAKSAHPELQMGAVSGLADVEGVEATGLLAKALPDLTVKNRSLAVAALLRTPDRIHAFLDAVEKGTAKIEWLTDEQRSSLKKHPDEKVRARSTRLP